MRRTYLKILHLASRRVRSTHQWLRLSGGSVRRAHPADFEIGSRPATKVFLFLLALGVLSGCAGTRTFHEAARAGDTVALAAGWKQDFKRSNLTVTITPSSGAPVVYGPNDPAVRAVVNLYPDPVSSLVVSIETAQDLTPYARTYGNFITDNYTGGDKDWWQAAVFIDLPTTLPTGTATISISNPAGETASSTVEIVSGTGTPNTFRATGGPLNNNQLASMERVGHYTISFTGSTIPFAIQLDLAHDPDVDHGGAGRAYVVNPRGDLKNTAWKDDGVNLRVILTPAKGTVLGNMKDFKYYVAGGITGLQVVSVKAFDINGNPVTGVTAGVSY